ncbi:MAG: hypothetical protein H6765_01390 [Candidatus Peribacteria bacterium]|nr:MAG: hypothetical protein H6765_01390 [Candidatus Peribacteria bacterium]
MRNLSIIKNCIKILKAKAKKEKRELEPMFQDFLDTMYFHPPLEDLHTYTRIFHNGDTS